MTTFDSHAGGLEHSESDLKSIYSEHQVIRCKYKFTIRKGHTEINKYFQMLIKVPSDYDSHGIQFNQQTRSLKEVSRSGYIFFIF